MRLPLLLCLGSALLAQPSQPLPEPGRDEAFLARVLERPSEGQGRPWHTFRVPAEGASAVVEVVGELTAEEFRQVRFNEFLAWFREDLRKFLLEHGDTRMEGGAPAAGPGPRMATLGRARF